MVDEQQRRGVRAYAGGVSALALALAALLRPGVLACAAGAALGRCAESASNSCVHGAAAVVAGPGLGRGEESERVTDEPRPSPGPVAAAVPSKDPAKSCAPPNASSA